MISQSDIKAMLGYESGDCGILINALKSGDIDSEPTDAMRLGIYFEYLVTGGLPRNGEIPVPDKTLKGELTAPYKVVVAQAERTKLYLERMGIEIVNRGFFTKNEQLGISANIDVLCSSKDLGEFVLDLKYTSKIDDKWSEWGWTWSDWQKMYHGIQATHYSRLLGLPFYYMIAEHRIGGEIHFVNAEITQSAISDHDTLLNRAEDFMNRISFLEARPEVTRCEACPLYESCDFRATAPSVRRVVIENLKR
jgi:hypothetical protein